MHLELLLCNLLGLQEDAALEKRMLRCQKESNLRWALNYGEPSTCLTSRLTCMMLLACLWHWAACSR